MTAMATLYVGQYCLGFILSRGKSGFEAFTADEKSIGTFPTQRAAADAISEKARR
jgi:hypothetical protein